MLDIVASCNQPVQVITVTTPSGGPKHSVEYKYTSWSYDSNS